MPACHLANSLELESRMTKSPLFFNTTIIMKNEESKTEIKCEFSPAFPATIRWVTVNIEGKDHIYTVYYSQVDAEFRIIDEGTITSDLAALIISKLKRKITYEAKKK